MELLHRRSWLRANWPYLIGFCFLAVCHAVISHFPTKSSLLAVQTLWQRLADLPIASDAAVTCQIVDGALWAFGTGESS